MHLCLKLSKMSLRNFIMTSFVGLRLAQILPKLVLINFIESQDDEREKSFVVWWLLQKIQLGKQITHPSLSGKIGLKQSSQ